MRQLLSTFVAQENIALPKYVENIPLQSCDTGVYKVIFLNRSSGQELANTLKSFSYCEISRIHSNGPCSSAANNCYRDIDSMSE